MEKVNLEEKFARFDEQWSPKRIASINDYDVKIVKIQGEFVWHTHEDTDELFLGVDGTTIIRVRDDDGERAVELGPGDLFVVPRGIEHRPYAEQEAKVLLLEPKGVVNTGDAGGPMTAQLGEL